MRMDAPVGIAGRNRISGVLAKPCDRGLTVAAALGAGTYSRRLRRWVRKKRHVPMRDPDTITHARRSSLVARRSSLVARRSSLVARRSSLVARRSSLVARRSSLVARRSSLVARRSSLVARRSSLVAQNYNTSLHCVCLYFVQRLVLRAGKATVIVTMSQLERDFDGILCLFNVNNRNISYLTMTHRLHSAPRRRSAERDGLRLRERND